MSDPNLLQQKIDFFQKSADVKEQIAVRYYIMHSLSK